MNPDESQAKHAESLARKKLNKNLYMVENTGES